MTEKETEKLLEEIDTLLDEAVLEEQTQLARELDVLIKDEE